MKRTIRSKRRKKLKIIKINCFLHLLRPRSQLLLLKQYLYPNQRPQMLLLLLKMKCEKSLKMKQSFAPL